MAKDFSLYIHIPFCISKCSYCDFFSIKCDENFVPDSYVKSLCNEILFRKKQFDVSDFKTIYIGGGTPSLLKKNQLLELFDFLQKNTDFSKCKEISIEVNPDDLTEELLEIFEKCKINRISCGIQSLNESSLKYVHRRASLEQNLNAIKLLNSKWKNDFSLDFICALPKETKKSFLGGLKKIIDFKPSHISMYSLTIEENTELGKKIQNNQLKINSDFQDELWLKSRDFLLKNGYEQYEVSNFCLKNKECLHNLVYWNHKNYIGCGSGATGTVYNDDGSAFRWTNKNDIDGYIKNWFLQKKDFKNDFEIKENIDIQTSKFEFFMMGFRKLEGITTFEYESIFGEKIEQSKIDVFEKWNKKNLLDIKNENNYVRFSLNSTGILYLNSFLEELL